MEIKNKVVLDFDGIFASKMVYTPEGKSSKIFTWGIRHAIDTLVENGFDVYIITGDSTGSGQEITKKFLHNVNYKEIIFCNSKHKLNILKKKFNLNEIYYSGDDLYDIEIFKQCYGITHKLTHHSISFHAKYISQYTPDDYYLIDLVEHILSHNNITLEDTTYHTTHESLSDLLQDKRINNLAIIQQYSMRNHTDGLYNVLLDGNLNLTLNRLHNPLKNNQNLKVYITYPENANIEQLDELKLFLDSIYGSNRIFFECVPFYKLNAMENMEYFCSDNNKIRNYVKELESKVDKIISFFPLYDRSLYHKIIFNYNISKVENLERYYIDKFFDAQLYSVKYNKNNFYVLNENQKEYFIKHDINKNNIIVDTHSLNKEFLQHQINYFTKDIDENKIKEYLNEETHDITFFFPFRLSDTCYMFKEFLNYLATSYHECTIKLIITDPNESISEFVKPFNVEIYNLKDISNNTKGTYLKALSEMSNHDINIYVFEDPREVLHQTLIELYQLCERNVRFLNVNNKTFFHFEDISNDVKKYLDKLIQ